eukprot:scaffold15609_cov55-Attheya_sp.AAC.11
MYPPCLGPVSSKMPVQSWARKDIVFFIARFLSDIHLTLLCCEQLGKGLCKYYHGSYHGGSLLPDTISRGETHVLTPALFVPKGSWAVRSLTPAAVEVLLAHDWP